MAYVQSVSSPNCHVLTGHWKVSNRGFVLTETFICEYDKSEDFFDKEQSFGGVIMDIHSFGHNGQWASLIY
jgi:hypothetical protein